MPPPSPGENTAMQNQTQKEMTDKEKLAAVRDLVYEMEGLIISMDTTEKLHELSTRGYGLLDLKDWQYEECYKSTTIYQHVLIDRLEHDRIKAEDIFTRLHTLITNAEDGSK